VHMEPPCQINRPEMVSVPLPASVPVVRFTAGLVAGPLNKAVPPLTVSAAVMSVLPENVIVPPVTLSVGSDATDVIVSGPELKASAEEPCTLSELMVWFAAPRAPTATEKPVGMQTSSVKTGTAPPLQFAAVPHWPSPAVPFQVFDPQVPVAVPMPERGTVCGLPKVFSLSVMESVAVRVLVAEGVKVTSMTQVPLEATIEPFVHVVLAATMVKSAAFAPVTVTLMRFSVALPLLVSVTRCEALGVPTFCDGKLRLVGDKLTA